MSTAIAVGCAVGIPAGLVLLVLFFLWRRQQKHLKAELATDAENPAFRDANMDLDLDNIIEDDDEVSSNKSDNAHDIHKSPVSSDDFEKKYPKKNRRRNPYRKTSRVMGLRVVPRSQLPREETSSSSTSHALEQGSSSTAGNPGSNGSSAALLGTHTPSGPNTPIGIPSGTFNADPRAVGLMHSRGTSNQQTFIDYYESVIPILPEAQASMVSSPASSRPDLDQASDLAPPDSANGFIGSAPGSTAGSDAGLHRSQMSLQTEYIRQLNKSDQPSFPSRDVINLSPSQINLNNNYPQPHSSHSSLNLIAQKPVHHSSSLGISQATTVADSDSTELTQKASADTKPVSDEVDITAQKQPRSHSSNDSWEAKTPNNTIPSLQTPFDTPPRKSQFLSPLDDTSPEPEYVNMADRVSVPVDNRDLGAGNYDEDFGSNYERNKRDWLASVKPASDVH